MKPYLLTINTLKTNNPSFECLLYLLYSEGVAPGYSPRAKARCIVLQTNAGAFKPMSTSLCLIPP